MILFQGEEIKEIEGYEGKYLISNFGRVYSFISNRWLRPTKNKHGNGFRLYVNLGRGAENRFYIHQLVAKAFVENPNNYTEIDHIDTNTLNNRADNLRWVSHAENMKNEKTKEKISFNGSLLFEIRNKITNKTYWGYYETAKAENVSRQTIINHCKNKVKNPRYELTGRKKDEKRNKIYENDIDNKDN